MNAFKLCNCDFNCDYIINYSLVKTVYMFSKKKNIRSEAGYTSE